MDKKKKKKRRKKNSAGKIILLSLLGLCVAVGVFAAWYFLQNMNKLNADTVPIVEKPTDPPVEFYEISTPVPEEASEPTQEPTTPEPSEEPVATSEETEPTAPPPDTSTPEPPSRDFDAEFDAGLARVGELGYRTFGASKSEHNFEFANTNSTYYGLVELRSDGKWCVDYYPASFNDPGATYFYHKTGNDLVAMINEIDSSWMDY